MPLTSSLLLLSLLACLLPSTISSASPDAAAPLWPRHIPPGLKYFPEDEAVVQRGLAAQRRILADGTAPTGMRRMSGDPDEMFFLDYWLFADDDDEEYEYAIAGDVVANATGGAGLRPAMLAHAMSPRPRGGLLMRALRRRDFSCPSGFNSCAGIGRQYSCCATGSTCVSVQNNGLGDVGCCANGASCGGAALGSCDASRGYKSCPGSSNGGCCLPGFDCLGVGCVSVSTSTTTTTLGLATIRACQSGDQTCASSLGGGCCPATLTCGSSNTCLGAQPTTILSTSTTTTTAAATVVAPVRPTSVAPAPSASAPDVAIAPSITTTGTQLLAVCPTNYYFCSAYYRPGCCQIGRDCRLTNCPAAAASSTLVSNGVTIVVPVGTSTGGTTYEATALITGTAAAASFPAGGSCMDGWATCAQSLLGGCCPQGFSCGAVCTGNVGSGQTVVAKMRPSAASSLRPSAVVADAGWTLMASGLVFGSLMILL